jgi:hypothetical protein
MWLQRGDVVAQAIGLTVGPRCVALTAGHAVKRVGETVRLTTLDGLVFGAEVIGLDTQLDAALLLLDESARSDNGGCRSVRAVDLQLLAEYERDQIGQPALWVELAASRLGGLDRFDIALTRTATHEAAFDFTAKHAPDPLPVSTDGRIHSQWSSERRFESLAHPRSFGRMPQMGHSGAGLWLGSRDSGHWTHDRYQDGLPLQRTVGQLAGMFIRRSDSFGHAVTARALQGFVARVVRPTEPGKLTVDVPPGIAATYRPGMSKRPFLDFYSIPYEGAFEFDMGDEALEFSAVELEFEADDANVRRASPLAAFAVQKAFADIRVEVSTKAASEAGPTRQLGCRALDEVAPSVRREGLVRMRCELSQVTIPAAITVSLRGLPGTWRTLRLELKR